jgi:DNA-binding SARP family transcriptional activator/tetratricopeptide (TPR) repeat protein/TolB-like protein
MIQLTVLGDIELRSDDGNLIGSVLSQPRRLALLVYLGIESSRGGVQRDRLLGVFWPELPQDQARQSLRTALHFLRRSLGPGAIETDGTAVRLDPARITCDAASFLAALEAGHGADALRRYRGDLLPGFHLDGGPAEFERWLDETRAHLRRHAADTAWSLAAAQEADGNAPGAGAWARTAARLSDGDEAAVRRAIELLGRIGDRAGALAAYDELASRLATDFDASPSPETDAAVARARTDGERDSRMAAADAATGAAGVEPAAASSAVRGAATGSRPLAARATGPRPAAAGAEPSRWRSAAHRGSRALYSTAVTLILVAGFYSLWGLGRGGTHAAVAGSERAAVLEIDAIRDFSADGSTQDLAGALTMELTGRLGDIHALEVLAAQGARRAEGPAPMFVLRGSLVRADSMVRMTVMLLDGASGATLERITVDHPIHHATGSELAEVMARRVRREIGRIAEDRERGASAKSPHALALVRAALRDMEAGDSLRTAGAIEAAAFSFSSADSQLATAQTMAARWTEPSVQRAELEYRRMWLHLRPPAVDMAAAGNALRIGVRHADDALAIAGDDPAALELRGLLNYWRWRLRAGSETEYEAARRQAEADLLRATALDAGRGRAWSVLSALHQARGDFTAAHFAARRAHRADPYLENAIETIIRLFNTSLEIGDPVAARRWCEELGRRNPDSWLPAYCALEQMAWYGPPGDVTQDSIRSLIDAAAVARGATQGRADFEMLGAVILARMGASGALEAIEAARELGREGDAYVLMLEAWARTVLGDDVAALALLVEATAADRRTAPPTLASRRFERFRNDGWLTGME